MSTIGKGLIDTFIASSFSPQYANLWTFSFSDNELMRLKIDSITVPFTGVSTEQKSWGTHYPSGVTHPNTVTMVFREDNSMIPNLGKVAVYRYFKNWQESIYSSTKRVFRVGPAGKKRTGFLHLEKSIILTTPSLVLEYQGLMLQSMQDLSLDYTQGDGLKISCTFTVDRVVDKLTEQMELAGAFSTIGALSNALSEITQ